MTHLSKRDTPNLGSRSARARTGRTRARYRLAVDPIEKFEDRVLLTAISLGAASGFAALGGTTLTNTGATTVTGDVGVSPGTVITGFPPGVVTSGTIDTGDTLANQAHADTSVAYNVIAAETPTTVLTATDLGGVTLTPGVYQITSAAQLSTTLTLNAQGNPNARFDFQIGSTLTTSAASSIVLINDAQASNVYFQIGSSATLGATSTFVGTILANTSIAVGAGASFLDGRALAINGAVTLDDNILTSPAPLTSTPTAATATPVQAVAGQSTGMVVLASFVDTDPSSTVHDWNAQINWGDSTPVTTAVVELAGGDPTTGGNVFDVVASHTYVTAAAITTTPTVTITDVGNPLNPPVLLPLSITLVDSAITSSNGTSINGTEGISTGTVLLGTFADANSFATAGNFTATIPVGGWGDGTPTAAATLTVTEISATSADTVFTVTGSHTYAHVGQFPVTIDVTDAGGAITVISSAAVIADAALSAPPQTAFNTTEAIVYPITLNGTPVFNSATSGQPVATFTSADPTATIASFTATIDWGDGSSPSIGTITQPGGVGTVFDVLGSHTYATSGVNGGIGHYSVQALINDVGGSSLTVSNTANVADIPIAVVGTLNPTSDSGESNLDDITNVAQPTFSGTVFAAGTSTPEPYATVSLFANGVSVGRVQAGGDGTWSIRTSLLAQGTYTVTASATDQFGQTVSPVATIATSLVVDTAPPVVDNVYFDRFDGTLTVTYQSSLSGLDVASITNSAFYQMSAQPIRARWHTPKVMYVTAISYTPGATPTDPVVVNVVFNHGILMRGGLYTVDINSGTGDTGVQDVAGNALDGNYYGSFASGDGLAGGDFVGQVLTHDALVYAFFPLKDGYVPPSAATDPPASSNTVKIQKNAAAAQKTKPAVDVVTKPVLTTRLRSNALATLATKVKIHHRIV